MAIFFTPIFKSSVVLTSFRNSLLNTPTYIYVSDAGNTATSTDVGTTAVLRSLVLGKKIQAADLVYLITRLNWTSGTIYSKYDDLIDEQDVVNDYFTLASNRAVYKCLYNNDGAPSTIEPSSFDLYPIELGDGYIWQYMYQLTVDQIETYASTALIPFVEDAAVTAAAVSQSVSYIDVVFPGTGYLSVTGSVQQVISNNTFRVDEGSTATGTYNLSGFYITSGAGQGSLSIIETYVSNSSGKFVVTATPLPNVEHASVYSISPSVVLTGDGSGAKARTVMDGGTVSSVEIVSRGSNYSTITGTVQANSIHGSGATLRVITAPQSGHGGDVLTELRCNSLGIFVELNGTESNTVPDSVTFNGYGLIQNMQKIYIDEPYVANTFTAATRINFTQVTGSFAAGDVIRDVANSLVFGSVLVANSNNVIMRFTSNNYFDANDTIVSQTGAIATVTSTELPDILPVTGEILSYTAINSITRTPDSNELINITLRV